MRWRRAISAGPWPCPWCFNQTMYAEIKGHGRLVLFKCGSCKLGEMLPRVPNVKIIDLYNAVCDNARTKKVPAFKVKRILKKDLAFMRKHISLGKIEAMVIIDESSRDVERTDS